MIISLTHTDEPNPQTATQINQKSMPAQCQEHIWCRRGVLRCPAHGHTGETQASLIDQHQ